MIKTQNEKQKKQNKKQKKPNIIKINKKNVSGTLL